MRFVITCSGILVLAGLSSLCTPALRADRDPYGEFIAQTNPRTPAEEKKCFHLPPGFEIELVAAEPAIIKPINLNFDDRGRIWVTQSVEYPFPAKGERKPRDTVKILEDTDGDGVADKITTFTDGLNIPIGILPITRGAIVYSIPNIYRFQDGNGDDHADKKEFLYGSIGFADTHGMTSSFTWGFDGWIYACHGFSNTSTVKGADGQAIRMQSGNTYRMKPDGSHVEQYTHGQVNPFGLCFDPLGNLYSADCHTKPVMMLLRNGYYQSFGKPDDGLGFAPEMCDHDHGSTAIAGIVYYAAEQFPREFRDNVFIGNVVTNRINRDRLERHGSSYKAIEMPDFLKCDDPWFRPVDIKMGPDGAMYVADFYNRIIGHYEVPLTHPGRDHERGRIWRIYYRGTDANVKRPVSPCADFGKATVPKLVSDLAQSNLVVRMKAMNQLVERGGADGIAALQSVMDAKSNAWQRMHGLWILERLHALKESTLEAAIRDPENGVRVHAMRILAERPTLTPAEHALIVQSLKDGDAFVQRTAAEALGTHPAAENVAPLLALRHTVPADDTHLLHMGRMALRDQLRPADTWTKLAMASWSEPDRRAVADVAPGVPTAEAAKFLLAHVQSVPEPGNNQLRYVHHVARYGTSDVTTSLLAFARENQPKNLLHQAALFKAMQQGTQERGAPVSAPAREWAASVAHKLLDSAKGNDMLTGAELAASLRMKDAQVTLSALAGRKSLPEPQRRASLDALMAIDGKAHIAALGEILADSTEGPGIREHVARLLAGMNRSEAHAELIKTLSVAPAPLQNAIANGLVNSPQGAEKLLEAISAGKASARLLQEWGVHLRLDKYPGVKERVAKLTQGLPPADQRMQELFQRRRTAYAAAPKDTAAGARVYEKSCAICHQLGGKGAKVGPQLDGIGVRGLDRLLEDILDPNRNVDQAFRSTALLLKNGQIISGLVLREEGEVVIVADAQGKEVRVTKNSIDERTVSQLSPMPANLVDQISEADFSHLLAFLLAQRQK